MTAPRIGIGHFIIAFVVGSITLGVVEPLLTKRRREAFSRSFQVGFFPGSQRQITAAAFSADGRWLATGDDGGVIRLWEVGTRTERRTLSGHEGCIEALSFSKDGRRLSSGGTDARVRSWDLGTGREERTSRACPPTPIVEADPCDRTRGPAPRFDRERGRARILGAGQRGAAMERARDVGPRR
jgi:hypothetical protein